MNHDQGQGGVVLLEVQASSERPPRPGPTRMAANELVGTLDSSLRAKPACHFAAPPRSGKRRVKGCSVSRMRLRAERLA